MMVKLLYNSFLLLRIAAKNNPAVMGLRGNAGLPVTAQSAARVDAPSI